MHVGPLAPPRHAYVNPCAPLIEQVQSMFPAGNFPIIGLSSDPWTTSERLARLGIDRFITKPFSVSLLRSAARELLEATRTA